MRHDLCSKIMRVKLAHNGHDIEALAITFKNGECGVEVTIEWLEALLRRKRNSACHTEYSVRKTMLNPGPRLPHCVGSMLVRRTLKLSSPFSDESLFSRASQTRQPFTVKRRLEFPATTRIAGKMPTMFFGLDSSDPPAVSPKSMQHTEARSLLKRLATAGASGVLPYAHIPPSEKPDPQLLFDRDRGTLQRRIVCLMSESHEENL